jgi:hypothetical protein
MGVFFLLLAGSVAAQKSEVTFMSADSLRLSADNYFLHDTLPYLVMVHEQGSSKGEFYSIADRFMKMDLNCLAVDVRNGGDSRYFSNKTVKRMRKGDFGSYFTDVENDIKAAIHFAQERTSKDVYLLGAGANGSLCMKIAREEPLVRAVIAMSPGEFFRPALNIEDTISGLEKPLLVTATVLEFPYIEQMVSGVAEEYKTLFKPETAEGERGTSALLPDNPTSGEYWLALLLFFKELK